MTSYTIDLNARRAARAARREAAGDTIPVTFGDDTYQLPCELPAAVFTPLIDGDLDLAWLLKGAFDAYRQAGPGNDQDKLASLILEGLSDNPSLPVDVLRAIRAGLQELFGEKQWNKFWGQRPSLPDLIELLKGCWALYGVSLGEAFTSPASSDNGGATSKVISDNSTASTPAVAGAGLMTPSSSAFGGS